MRVGSKLTILLTLAIVWPKVITAGKAGDAGALFLRIGMGARASAMGEAQIGLAQDASTVYWNPAAMAPVQGTKLLLVHNEYLQSIRLEQVAVTHETDLGTIGFSFTGLYMDEMDRYADVPTSTPLGKFSSYDVAFAVAFARYLLPDLTAGVAVKPVYEKIDERTAKGVAFDLGLYHVSRLQGVSFSAVIANVGSPLKFVSEEFALPRVVKIGGSYTREVPPGPWGRMILTLDILFPNDGDVREHLGIEYGYRSAIFLRAGYKAGYDSQGATFGFGVHYRTVDLDYAFLLVGNNLGDSHRFALGFNL